MTALLFGAVHKTCNSANSNIIKEKRYKSKWSVENRQD